MFDKSQQSRFDWAGAIEINRDALIMIVAALFRMLRIEGDDEPERLPRHLHRAALRLLRPAESAARRVIVMAARGLAMPSLPALRPKAQGAMAKATKTVKLPDTPGRSRVPAFKLYDKRLYFPELVQHPRRRRRKLPDHLLPRIAVLDYSGYDPRIPAFLRPQPEPVPLPPPPPEPEPDDGQITAQPLCRRLWALKAALEDVPRQAKRLMRWQARREQIRKLRPIFVTPLRPGHPPGHRKKPTHEVDRVLAECSWLAWDAMRTDTS